MGKRIIWCVFLCLPWTMTWGQNTNCWVNGNYVSCTQAPSAQNLLEQQQAQQRAVQERQAQSEQQFWQQYQQIKQNTYQQEQIDLQRQQLELERQKLQQQQQPQPQPQPQLLVQPNDVDLKAAYCLGSTNFSVARREAQIKNWGHENNASFQALKRVVQDGLDRQNQGRDRINAYLQPRLTNMDMALLLAAKNQGEDDAMKADIYSNKVCSPKCLHASDMLKCVDACEANSEPYQHAKICAKMSFLPY